LLERYRQLLLDANKSKNLVSRRDVNNLTGRLISESLQPLSLGEDVLVSPLLDIGSGGGLPGIPLKIAKPELNITLLDSNRKKTLFLRRVINELALSDTQAIWQRAENFVFKIENTGRFNTVVSRGVGLIDSLLDWSANLLKSPGHLIVWRCDLNPVAEILHPDFEPMQVFRFKDSNTLLVWKKR